MDKNGDDSHAGRNPRLEKIEKLLGSIDRPGDYCAHGRLFAPMPLLEIKGAGALSFPVPDEQIRAIIARASRSPVGKGPETLLDDNVRKSREVAPGGLRLGGKAWDDTFKGILDAAADGLGCSRDRLSAELYKLLIYEPGGFFLPHRDTEKTTGMVATLVVSLPVPGEGGEIIVRHKGRETSIEMSVNEPSELAWAAFYADCEHEIRPVSEGYRIVLVFNLILKNGRENSTAPDFGAEAEKITRELSAWSGEAQGDTKIIWLLDHDYSEAGLCFESLKNIDAAVAGVLAEAAPAAGCSLHAAIVSIEEYGEAVYDGNHGYYAYDDGPDDLDFSMGEICDSHCRLENLIAPDGTGAEFGDIPFYKHEIMPAGSLEDIEPGDQGIEEWTGNAGVTFERSYRLSALVLWPRSNSLKVAASGDVNRAVGYVETLLERNEAEGKAAASGMADIWSGYGDRYTPPGTGEALCRAIRILVDLEDAYALTLLLLNAVIPHYGGEENHDIGVALSALGPDVSRSFLSGFVEINLRRRPEPLLALAAELCEQRGDDARWKETLVEMCEALARALSDAVSGTRDGPRSLSLPDKVKLSPEGVRNLLVSFLHLDLSREAARAADVLIDHPESASPDRVIPRALGALAGFAGSQSLETLWRHACEFLLRRSQMPPEPPKDWTIGSSDECGCGNCRELKAFCEDPVATEYRLKARQSVRDHLSFYIERGSLDLSCRTEKARRPYTLVCTKNRASHEKRRKRYEEDIAEMKRLASVGTETETLKLIRAAIDRSG